MIINDRKRLFKMWYAWSIRYGDCDPAIWAIRYVFKRLEFNSEQKYWLIWLFANTYNLPTAWILWNEFPDFEVVSTPRLEERFGRLGTESKKIYYQKDQKWQKGRIGERFTSYTAILSGAEQETYFKQNENFDHLFELFQENHKGWGRYTLWFYFQALQEVLGHHLDPPRLFLHLSSAHTQRDGLVYSQGRDELVGQTLSKEQTDGLEAYAKDLLEECRSDYPNLRFDFYSMETSLCSFKKIFRRKQSRYLGYYLDRQAQEILQYQNADYWKGINWDLLWEARAECLDPRLITPWTDEANGFKDDFVEQFHNSGSIERLGWVDEPGSTTIMELMK